MILDISRGCIKVKMLNRTATIQGEMFFPGNDKLGFVIYSNTIKYWDPPDQNTQISLTEKQLILDDIRKNFSEGGHTLDIE
jgi:hypothetical protein